MQNAISIECPVELLLTLFKEGKISSGIAAQWLNMPRVTFLLKAMEAGAVLLEDSQDDFNRELSLL